MLTPGILRTYRRRLTNLSSRNRSLLLPGLPAEQFLDLHETDFLLNKPSFDILAQLIGSKRPVPLCDILDARDERVNMVSKKLRRIARTERFIEAERGSEDLYVGWPFVRGKFMDGTVVHGPLLFFPVHLEQQQDQWKLTRRGDELAQVNQSMLLAYAHYNQVRLDEPVVNKAFDDVERLKEVPAALAFRNELYEWLKESTLRIHFNQDLFIDRLQAFDKLTAKSLEQLERTGELKLYSEAVLGIFPQAGSFLVPDYDTLLDQFTDEEAQPDPFDFSGIAQLANQTIREAHLYTPLPMDASQEQAIRAVKTGESLVVQGPPGTGKSQLIANLMADAAAQGQRVLLVCQKRAALDVVYERLKQVGLSAFTALVHDFQDDRKALYYQIATQIDQIDAYRQQNHSLDAVLLERDFDAESRQIDQLLTELADFKTALFDSSVCGIPARELYLSAPLQEQDLLPDLGDLYTRFPFDEKLTLFQRQLADYAAYQQRLGPTHPWHDRRSFSQTGAGDITTIDRLLVTIPVIARETGEQLNKRLDSPFTLADIDVWQEEAWPLNALLTLIDEQADPTIWTIAQGLRGYPDHPANQLSDHALSQLIRQWEAALTGVGPLVGVADEALNSFAALLREARQARASWVNWHWWQLTHAGKDELQRIVQANGLTNSGQDLQTLALKLANRQILAQLKPQVQALLSETGTVGEAQQTALQLRQLHLAHGLAARFADLAILQRLAPAVWLTAHSFNDTIQTILNTVGQLHLQRISWQTYLTDAQIERLWQQDQAFAAQLRRSLQQDIDFLIEADRLREQFSPTGQAVLQKLAGGSVDQFMGALRLAWLHHIERLYPQLRTVSSLRMQQMEATLQASVQKKQALSRDILLVRLREQTYRNLAFNRLNNLTTYRELLHQTTKKRNVWPVRKLIEQHAGEVFRLIPCWMASPESVSAMFPLEKGLFDIVIFDEASQCFAENGIPAIYRGKQIVVTGDSQQLRPSDLYRIRPEDPAMEDDVPAALEVESLLELAAQWLPQVSLTGHYRSRTLDLIQFSNQHFYQNRLTLLPDFREINRAEPAISYQHVGGTWTNNTNLAEAQAVLALITRLQHEQPDRSIGVVTFNYPQQTLIQELIDQASRDAQSAAAASTSLFVKNIENVQGDERDIIIFSVGYAPRISETGEAGRLAMQFGSLNTRGGENRLNVAITRAREKVFVITSLWPEQLQVESAAHDGPRLLKAYLAYARQVSERGFRPGPRVVEGLRTGALLKDRLARQEPAYRSELPFADLTIKTGETYQGVLLTDDDQYWQQTVKEAHAYVPLALANRHWPFRRVWSREYWRGALTSPAN
ncbi:AAA domain-containing protein [Arsenicibacter rosenii]|uniref:DNA helicase n=1 Tax=Arsenicibacter rosenii TaxID=1750698 RepID=A0A1S2VMR3_9BACT|nr:AAA domain-containing protein [Arsenicibacter rosenii]OIN60061.1 DNA helicase [Arsenicibacter rosenii]